MRNNYKISTNQLFHFTKFESLISILENGFYPKYSLEFNELFGASFGTTNIMIVPMVCFCDIPLNLVKQHSRQYGRTAIGLSKKWGVKKSISPIFYISENSLLADALSNQTIQILKLGEYFKRKNINDKNSLDILQQLFGVHQVIHSFLKPYEFNKEKHLTLQNNTIKITAKRFYDEREWRYSPFYTATNYETLFLPEEDFINKEKRELANNNLKRHPLNFMSKDIEYIILESQSQIGIVKKILQKRFKDISHIKFKLLSSLVK